MNTYDMSQLQDDHLDMLIKLAFDLEDMDHAQRLLETPDPELTPEESRLADEALLLAYTRLDAQKKRPSLQKAAAAARKALPWVINTAACIILLLALATPVALANSSTFRARVMQLLVEFDNDKGEAYFNLIPDEEASFDVPSGWEGEFFPSYIPEGFSIFEYPEGFFTRNIGYSDSNGNRIYFDEHNSSVSKLSGTEGGTIEYVDINGSIGCMIYSATAVDLSWEKDGKLLCLNVYGLSTDEALQVARSVRRIVK